MIGGIQNIGRIPSSGDGSSSRSGCSRSTASARTSRRRASTPTVIKSFFEQMQGTVFGLFNLFSGGALEQLSIFALGIMPYISASIIFQLLTIVIPQLEAAAEGRRAGPQQDHPVDALRHRSCSRCSRASLIAIALENGQFGEGAVLEPGLGLPADDA